MKTQAILLSILGVLVVSGPRASAIDADHFEVDIEEAMSDGDAAQEIAKIQKEELKKERKETRELERTARTVKANALLRRKDAQRQLVRTEDQINTVVSRKNQLNNEINKANNDMIAAEKALDDKKVALERAKGQLTTVEDLAKERQQKLAGVREEQKKVERDIIQTQRKIGETKTRFERDQRELANETARLQAAMKASANEQARLDAQIKTLRAAYQEGKTRNAKVASQVERQKQRTNNSRENLKWAQEQKKKKRQPASRKVSQR